MVCRYGQGVVRELFAQIAGTTVKGFSLWLPTMDGDNEESAQAGSTGFPDDLVQHVWDPQRSLGELFAKTLSLKGIAWDVYLLYKAGVTWDTDLPPEPTFWMHQLPVDAGADGKAFLNPARFSQELLKLLGKGDGQLAWDLAFLLHLKGLSALKNDKVQSSVEDVLGAVGIRNSETGPDVN